MELFYVRFYKLVVVLVTAIVLTTSLLTLLHTTSAAALLAQPVRAREVRGILRGGGYAQTWLRVEPEFADALITVLVEWDRLQPAANGLNFFVLDEQQLRRLQDGEADSLSAIALAAGSSNFELTMPNHVLGAGFKATGWAFYSIVIYNASPEAANFVLRVTNAFIVDDSEQVTLLETPAPTEESVEDSTLAARTLLTLSTEVELASLPLPTETLPTEIESGEITTPTVSISSTLPTTFAPIARTGLGRATPMVAVTGTLFTQAERHLLRLQPNQPKQQILLRLSLTEDGERRDPTLSSPTVQHPNFWVFDEVGFRHYQSGIDPRLRAITTGKRVFRGVADERVAGFRVTDTLPYTVVIYSDATLPIQYTIRVDGARLYLPLRTVE